MKVITNICLFIAALLPCAVLACSVVNKPGGWIPSEKEKIANADVVLVARVVAIKEEQIVKLPYIYRVTLYVKKWVKGSGDPALEIFDMTGTDCDEVFGIRHIYDSDGVNHTNSQWRIFARRSDEKLWVITADPIK
jgi:hypothetical protein